MSSTTKSAAQSDAPSAASGASRPPHRRGLSGITPRELKYIDSVIPLDRRQKWKEYSAKPIETGADFEAQFVRNVETTLGRSLYNCDSLAAYQATARSIRDTLIVRWNLTQQKQTLEDPKRVYYLSLEYLMGRALDNAALNLGLKKDIQGGLEDFGFQFEDVIDREPDAGLGNGGLGRLAACFVDSLCTLDYPAWAYGIRYKYGIFRQKIVDGAQVEFPDSWLDLGNPWEIPRPEVAFDVMFYGRVIEEAGRKKWVGGDLVEAKAFDFLVPGYGTHNVNTLRLWDAQPSSQFDFAKFNEGDYTDAVAEQVDASTISAVLYPNDNFYQGKELRLKQQYFWVAASLADIVRRFKKTQKPWSEFGDSNAIQLNDTHPTLAVVELLRILVDQEGLDWHEAWAITTSTFAYTNHTVMPEALEKWGVDIMGNLLPRHLEIVYNINYFFLKDVAAKFPGDDTLLGRVSLIEESSPKQVRMAYLAVIATKKVNGVAELHSELIKTTIFKDFVKIFGENHFTNVTNGITPRRWLLEANPRLAALIASKLGGYGYIKDLNQLKHLAKHVDDAEFRAEWVATKEHNKRRLVELIKTQHPEVEIDPTALFDIQVKRIHEYKRQQLNLFGIVYRYLYLKSLTPEQRRHIAPRVSIFGGKSAPGYYAAKLIIKLINSVGKVIAEDPDVNQYLKVVYVEEYNVSKAQVLVAASDISEHISTAGTEASGTSNMKFVLNGGLVIGTVDGANIEIGREVGEENVYFFGHLSESVEDVRREPVKLSSKLAKVFETIDAGVFGPPEEFSSLLDAVRTHGDYYLVNADFDAYIEKQSQIDQEFTDKEKWTTKTILSVSQMGFFSSDRAINEYAENIWDAFPSPVEAGEDVLAGGASSTADPSSSAPVSASTYSERKTAKRSNAKRSSRVPAGASSVAPEAAVAAAAAAGAAGAAVATSGHTRTTSNTTHGIPGVSTNNAPSSGQPSIKVVSATSPSGASATSPSGNSTSGTIRVDASPTRQAQTSSSYRAPAFTSAPIGGDFPVYEDANSSNYGSTTNLAYDPVGGQDEGQVTGSYGSYKREGSVPTEDTDSHATYGSAGNSPIYGSAAAVPQASQGESSFEPVGHASDRGTYLGEGQAAYDPHGSTSDKPVALEPVEKKSLFSEVASVGSTEGTSSAQGTLSAPLTGATGAPNTTVADRSFSGPSSESKPKDVYDTGVGLAAGAGAALAGTGAALAGSLRSSTPATSSAKETSKETTSTSGPGYIDQAQGALAGAGASVAGTLNNALGSVKGDANTGATSSTTASTSGPSYLEQAQGALAGAGASATGAVNSALGSVGGSSSKETPSTTSTKETSTSPGYLEQAQGALANAGASVTGSLNNALGSAGSGTDAKGTTTTATSSGPGYLEQAQGALAGAGASVAGSVNNALGTSGTEATKETSTSSSASGAGSAGYLEQAQGALAGAGASATGTINNALGSLGSNSTSSTSNEPGVLDKAYAGTAAAGTAVAGAAAAAFGSNVSGREAAEEKRAIDSAGREASAGVPIGERIERTQGEHYGPSSTATSNYGSTSAPSAVLGASSSSGSGSAAQPSYKTLDPAASSTEPVVTDGIVQGTAPTKSVGTETGVKSNVPKGAQGTTGTIHSGSGGVNKAPVEGYNPRAPGDEPGVAVHEEPKLSTTTPTAGASASSTADTRSTGPTRTAGYDPTAPGDEPGVPVHEEPKLSTKTHKAAGAGALAGAGTIGAGAAHLANKKSSVPTHGYDPTAPGDEPGVSVHEEPKLSAPSTGIATINATPGKSSSASGTASGTTSRSTGTAGYDPTAPGDEHGVSVHSEPELSAPTANVSTGRTGTAGAAGAATGAAVGTAAGSHGASSTHGYNPRTPGDEAGVAVHSDPKLSAPSTGIAEVPTAPRSTGSTTSHAQGYDPTTPGDERGVAVHDEPKLSAPSTGIATINATPGSAKSTSAGSHGTPTTAPSHGYNPAAPGDEHGVPVHADSKLSAPTGAGLGAAAGLGAGALGAGGLSESASTRTLDSRTAPVPDSEATVTSRYDVAQYEDGRRLSRGSYGTTGDTEFEDALDYEEDRRSVSSQSTIGKSKPEEGVAVVAAPVGATARGSGSTAGALGATGASSTAGAPGAARTADHSTLDPSKSVEPLNTEPSSGVAVISATPGADERVASSGSEVPASAGTAATKATTSTAATHHSTKPDLIPTDVLKRDDGKTVGGDGSATRGPAINPSKVEEMHDEVIQAAEEDGHTEGITEKKQAGGAPSKSDTTEVEAPSKKKSCICC